MKAIGRSRASSAPIALAAFSSFGSTEMTVSMLAMRLLSADF